MPSDNGEPIRCNARKKGNGDARGKRDPGAHAGDGYCPTKTGGGRCRMHAGRKTSPPVKHGLHSNLREELREYVEKAASMDAPGDLQGELAVLRGLLFNFLEDREELDKEAIDAAHKILKEIRRTSDTIHKQMTRERLTKDEEEKLFNTFAKILRKYVSDESDRDAALDELDAALTGSGRPTVEGSQ